MGKIILRPSDFTHRKARYYAEHYIKNIFELHDRFHSLLEASLGENLIEIQIEQNTPLNYLDEYIKTLSCGIAINFELTKSKSIIIPILEIPSLEITENKINPKKEIYLVDIIRTGSIKNHRSLANKYRERLHNLEEWHKYRLRTIDIKDQSQVTYPKKYLIA